MAARRDGRTRAFSSAGVTGKDSDPSGKIHLVTREAVAGQKHLVFTRVDVEAESGGGGVSLETTNRGLNAPSGQL